MREPVLDGASSALVRAFLGRQLVATHGHLHVHTPGCDPVDLAAGNINRELALGLPGFEFVVTLEDECAWIHWTDGPIEDDVYGCTMAFSSEAAEHEGRTGLTIWQETFGHVKSVRPVRNYSDRAVMSVIASLRRRGGPAFEAVPATVARWKDRALGCHFLSVAGVGRLRAQNVIDYALARASWPAPQRPTSPR